MVEDEYKASWLIRMARKLKITPKSKGVLLVNTEERVLIQLDALPEWDCMHASVTATGIIDEFSERPFHLLIINKRKQANMYARASAIGNSGSSYPLYKTQKTRKPLFVSNRKAIN